MTERQKGWVHVPTREELLAREAKYGRDISSWLEANFPDLCDPSPHPGAVAAVIRLHHRVGKGRLTAREHGPEIREFVAVWERRLGPTELEAGA